MWILGHGLSQMKVNRILSSDHMLCAQVKSGMWWIAILDCTRDCGRKWEDLSTEMSPPPRDNSKWNPSSLYIWDHLSTLRTTLLAIGKFSESREISHLDKAKFKWNIHTHTHYVWMCAVCTCMYVCMCDTEILECGTEKNKYLSQWPSFYAVPAKVINEPLLLVIDI